MVKIGKANPGGTTHVYVLCNYTHNTQCGFTIRGLDCCEGTVSMQFANMYAVCKGLSNYANTMHLGILVSAFSLAFWLVQHHRKRTWQGNGMTQIADPNITHRGDTKPSTHTHQTVRGYDRKMPQSYTTEQPTAQ